MILGAEDKLSVLEYELFAALREKVSGEVARIQKTAKAVAKLDVLSSLAYVAEQNHYCRPKLNHHRHQRRPSPGSGKNDSKRHVYQKRHLFKQR